MLRLASPSDGTHSENLFVSGSLLVPRDDGPWHLSIPVNPGWIPEDLGDGWVLEHDGCAPQGLGALLCSSDWTRPPPCSGDARALPTPVAVTTVAFAAALGGLDPLSGSFRASHLLLSGRGMQDESVDLAGLRLRRAEYDPPEPSWRVHVRDYPVGESLWRRCEREQPVLWDPPGELSGDMALFRCRAERMGRSDLDSAVAEERRLLSLGCRVLDPPSRLLDSSLKGRCLSLWGDAGLPVPEWRPLDPSAWGEAEAEFLGRHGACLARLDDEACSRATHLLSAGVDPSPRLLTLSQQLSGARARRPWAGAVLVRKVQPTGDRLLHCRSFVSAGRVLCTVPMYSHASSGAFSQWPAASLSGLLADCARCEALQASGTPRMLHAAALLGLDSCAIDMLLEDSGALWFLEANAYWGMGAGCLWPYSARLRADLDRMLAAAELGGLPSLRLRLDEWAFWGEALGAINKAARGQQRQEFPRRRA